MRDRGTQRHTEARTLEGRRQPEASSLTRAIQIFSGHFSHGKPDEEAAQERAAVCSLVGVLLSPQSP